MLLELRTKRSQQREKILTTLKRTTSHPTAEWVYNEVRQQIPNVSLGTIYRNLDILCRQGKIRELDFGEGLKRYDAHVQEHYHFVCEHCGTVKDLMIPPMNDVNDRILEHVQGEVSSHRLDFFGLCIDCLRKKAHHDIHDN